MQDSKAADITATQPRGGRGTDIQDIAWNGLDFTREQYRQQRMEQYKNYEEVPFSGDCSTRVISNYVPSIISLVFGILISLLDFGMNKVALINND